ncbi:MAG: PAS domain S-box protein [Kiritimatiellae bacterium]|nr:PAS domain S-box protein [Kiritimatiellia bacterium]
MKNNTDKKKGPSSGRKKIQSGPVKGHGIVSLPCEFHPDFISLAENSPNMIFVHYMGRVVYVNRLCEEIMGYTKEEFCSPKFDFRSLVSPECRQAIEKMFSASMKGREVESIEYKLITKDKRKLDAIISAILVECNGDRAILGIITDISYYKKIEEELHQERDREKKYLDIAGVMMMSLNTCGRVTMINRKGCEILGLTEDEIMGKDWVSVFVPKAEREKIRGVLEMILDEKMGKLRYVENSVICRNGENRILHWYNTLLTDDDGTITGILSSGLDVTDRSRMEEALRESEKRYKGLFENSPIGIYRTTPDGKILMANAALVRMLKYRSFVDLAKIDLHKQEYQHPEFPRKVFLEQIEKQGQILGFEAKWLRADGSVMYGRENSKAVRDETGRTLYYEGTVEDITEEKKTHEELEYRISFERLITSIATRFVNLAPDEIDAGINDALKELGSFMGDDRSYVFQFSEDRETMDNTHEWVADGIEPQIQKLKGLDLLHFSWCISQLVNKQVIKIPKVADLPPEAVNEKREFDSENIKALVMIPLVCGASTIGFIGFDSVSKERDWSEDAISLLKIVGEIIASAIERKRVEWQLRYRLKFEALITRISTRFVNILPEDVDKIITQALQDLGGFCGVERAFVFQVADNGSLKRTHWWDAFCVQPLPEDILPIDPSAMPHGLLKDFNNGKVISIGQAEELLSDAAGGNAELTVQRMRKFGMESVVCAPLTISGKVSAFIGFSSSQRGRKWSDDITSLIRIVGEIFAGAIEKSKTSQDLRSERRLVEALMDNVPDHIYFKDRESRFIRINKSHAKVFKLDNPSEAIGKMDKDFFSAEHATKAYKDEQEIIRTGKPVIGLEEKLTWDDGTVRWSSTTKMPLRDEKGNITGTFGISRNITERKLQEEENRRIQARMQHAQKLESLGVLSGGIAHDFNNLLMGILGNTGLALMELGPESPAWPRVKQIETVALRAAELTNQMLAYSGKSKFIIKSLNLANLVREMGHLLEVSISKKVKLVYDLVEKLPLVDGDPVQIRQVVMNLITNASDAMSNKIGTITLKVNEVKCDREYLSACYVGEDLEPGNYVCVEVIDTGCGMDAQTQARIFDPFFTTKITGRGLGLAAVLGIIRAHKGALKVYSEVGKGTDFKILFPCSIKQSEEKEVVREDKSTWNTGGTVLVIDDDEVVLTVTEQMLRKIGFEVIKSAEARLGLKQYRGCIDKVVAVILDITLPEITVSEVLKELRLIKKDIPIILISGYSEQSATEDITDGSYQGFLQKPFNTDALILKLRGVLAKK